MKRALFAWTFVSLIGLGCWGLVDSDNAGGQFWAGSDGGGSMDASDESASGGLVDGSSQDAATDGPETCASPVGGVFNCCNGKPCRGWCEPDGGCSCGDWVEDGCSAPTICCGWRAACTTEAFCNGDYTPYDGPEYDGGTDCAPNDDPWQQETSCCEGVPCWGNCELHDGAWQCSCFGIPGGCGPFDLICCAGGCIETCGWGPD